MMCYSVTIDCQIVTSMLSNLFISWLLLLGLECLAILRTCLQVMCLSQCHCTAPYTMWTMQQQAEAANSSLAAAAPWLS